MSDAQWVAELCPRCARRPQGESGFCSVCDREEIIERYTLEDAKRSHTRETAWRERTDEARLFDRQRQRRHRIREKVRPREPAPYATDPWEIALVGLHHAGNLRGAAKSAQAREHLEVVMETIRRLAFGPDDDG